MAPTISVWDMHVRPAIAPPRLREPVSPMKIFAGEVFHHRKPMQAPMMAGRDDGDVQRSRGRRSSVPGSPGAVDVDVAGTWPPLPEPDEHVRR